VTEEYVSIRSKVKDDGGALTDVLAVEGEEDLRRTLEAALLLAQERDE